MLVWKVTLLNDDTGTVLDQGDWKAVPPAAQDAGAYRLLTKEYGRATGKLLDPSSPKRGFGWKLHQIRTEPGTGKKFNHVALVVLGWKQDSKVLAYDVVRGRPIAGLDANKVKYAIPPTHYPGQEARWKQRSPPADTSPSRVPGYKDLKDILKEVTRISLEQARGDRTAKSAAEALEHLLARIEAA